MQLLPLLLPLLQLAATAAAVDAVGTACCAAAVAATIATSAATAAAAAADDARWELHLLPIVGGLLIETCNTRADDGHGWLITLHTLRDR